MVSLLHGLLVRVTAPGIQIVVVSILLVFRQLLAVELRQIVVGELDAQSCVLAIDLAQ